MVSESAVEIKVRNLIQESLSVQLLPRINKSECYEMKTKLKYVVQAAAVIISIIASYYGLRVNENLNKVLMFERVFHMLLESLEFIARPQTVKMMDERTLELN
jgi:hypothetical protein